MTSVIGGWLGLVVLGLTLTVGLVVEAGRELRTDHPSVDRWYPTTRIVLWVLLALSAVATFIRLRYN